MSTLTPGKEKGIRALSNNEGIIDALAIDQRGSLKKMIATASGKPSNETEIVDFKKNVSSELTQYTSGILLDPEYGLPAAKVRAANAGLLLAYERTGYDASEPGRLPDILDDWSVRRLKDAGADAIKFLLYYDVDENTEINHRKQVFIERLGNECVGEDIPLFLELVSYDANMDSVTDEAYSKVKPHKVIEMASEFSKPQYNVDVLKLEVPVNQKYVEGFTTNESKALFTRDEALALYKNESDATNGIPFIFLSAGVTAELFQSELKFAKEAGSTFNGVLCGRATWRDAVKPFAANGEAAGLEWLQTQGKANVDALNTVLALTATPWYSKYKVEA